MQTRPTHNITSSQKSVKLAVLAFQGRCRSAAPVRPDVVEVGPDSASIDPTHRCRNIGQSLISVMGHRRPRDEVGPCLIELGPNSDRLRPLSVESHPRSVARNWRSTLASGRSPVPQGRTCVSNSMLGSPHSPKNHHPHKHVRDVVPKFVQIRAPSTNFGKNVRATPQMGAENSDLDTCPFSGPILAAHPFLEAPARCAGPCRDLQNRLGNQSRSQKHGELSDSEL